MKGIFSYDSRFVGLLVKIFDYICLFILWGLFSIPIVTIGASTCAFYYTFNKVLIKERDYLGRSFIKSFKENFKQATGVFLLQSVLCSILVLSGYYTFSLKENFSNIFSWVFWGSVAMTYIWTRYWFPYISCFKDNTRTVLKNCCIIMIGNLPWSFAIFALFAVLLLLIYTFPGVILIVSAPYMALNGMIFNRILKKYMPPETEEDNLEDIESIEE